MRLSLANFTFEVNIICKLERKLDAFPVMRDTITRRYFMPLS